MAWYHWIAGFLIIIAGTTFTIVPEKPLWLWISILIVGVIGVLMVFLPPKKEDEYVSKTRRL